MGIETLNNVTVVHFKTRTFDTMEFESFFSGGRSRSFSFTCGKAEISVTNQTYAFKVLLTVSKSAKVA